MTAHEHTAGRPEWPWWRWLLTLLSVLGLLLSGYLSWLHLAGGAAIGCGGGSGCDQVLHSRWSTIAGILPTSALAVGAYLALLVASLCLGPSIEAPVRNLAWRAMLVIVGAAAGSAVWLTIVQKWIVGAFCPYCMATHATGVLLAMLVLWRMPRRSAAGSPSADPSHAPRLPDAAPRRRASWFALGLTLAGTLAAAQLLLAPPPVYRGGESPQPVSAVDFRAMPLVGSSNAPQVVCLLFDYECPHCQQSYFMLNEAIRQFNGQLAFALCPVPLNTNCNPYVQQHGEQFKDSCELAKIGLAVWLAKRAAFPDFNRWMFTFDSGDRWRPRTIEAARSKAAELVGRAALDAALTNAWLMQHIQTSTKIFGRTGGNAVPMLVFGSRWVIAQAQDADELVWILQERLGVPKPGAAANKP